MRRFSTLLLCLLLSLSVLAQTPTPAGKTANSELVAVDSTPITTTLSGPVGVITLRPLAPLPAPLPAATATPQIVPETGTVFS